MTPSHDGTTTFNDYQKALCAYHSGDLAEAEQLCRKAMKSAPDSADVAHLLGVIEFEQGNDENAVELFTRVTELNPKNAGDFVYLGAACHRTKDATKAIFAYRKAIALNPGLVDAHFQVGQVYQSQDELAEAETAYRHALNLDPGNALIYDALGTALQKSGRIGDAISCYRKGLSLNTQQASLYSNLGSALQEQNDLKAAEAAYLKALTLNPNSAEFHFNLGFNFEQQEQLDPAFKKYEKAVELDPHYINAQLGLARIHEECNEMQEAVKAYQLTIRLAPRTREAHTNLASILVDAEKFDEARVCYENVLRIDSNDADANEGLGEIYKELGKIDQAIGYYRRASELGSTGARYLLAALTNEDTQKAPRQYIEELFDSYSDDFEEHLIETLSYKSPKLLYEAFMRFNDGNIRFQRAIDLGCGTGLVGLAFQSIIDRLDGVDLSPEMLKKASEKGVYSNLYTADIVDCLNAGGEKYDLFIAADVLIYIGNLTDIFLAVKRRAAPGAYFLFSIESSDSKDFALQHSGRFTHSEGYIRSIAHAHKLTVLRCNSAPLRKEDEEWVYGKLFILKNTTGSSESKN